MLLLPALTAAVCAQSGVAERWPLVVPAPAEVAESEQSLGPYGRLTVRSQPSGARVMVDDRHVGATPLLSALVPPGRHWVSVSAPGYASWSASVVFVVGKTTDVEVRLTPAAPGGARSYPARPWDPDESGPVPAVEVAQRSAAPEYALVPPVPAGLFGEAASPAQSAPVVPLPSKRQAPRWGHESTPPVGMASSSAGGLAPATEGRDTQILSVALLATKGAPRAQEARVSLTCLSDTAVRCTVAMRGGFPEGTRVVKSASMVSITLPQAVTIRQERARQEVGMGGIAAIVVGQQSDREQAVRVEIDLDSTARVEIRPDLSGGIVCVDVALPSSRTEVPGPTAQQPGPPSKQRYPEPNKRVALTFDDFPSPGTSEELLAVLKAQGVGATFFVIGRKGARDPWLLRNAVREGHVLGNHTFSHQRLAHASYAEALEEMRHCNEVIRQATGKSPAYFRPPGGHYNGAVRSAARQAGLRIVMWDAASEDYKGLSPQRIVQDVLKTIGGNGHVIVLLHDGHRCTIKALPTLIHELRLRRYKLVTLDELYQGP